MATEAQAKRSTAERVQIEAQDVLLEYWPGDSELHLILDRGRHRILIPGVHLEDACISQELGELLRKTA